jgi:hypothetical protein
VETGSAIGVDEALASGLATGVLADASGAEDIARCLSRGPVPGRGGTILASALDAGDPVHDQLDLALLVRSAAAPGLKARIAAYVERGRPRPSSSPSHRPEPPWPAPLLP